jgi:hypothetical protein
LESIILPPCTEKPIHPMATPDPVPTSAHLRAAAVRAINEFKRPISAHELEQWIHTHDPMLSNEISAKCYDYVRIILSLTTDGSIIKFKSIGTIPGVDRRAAFYGLSSGGYDPKRWAILSRSARKKQQVAHPPPADAPRTTSEDSSPNNEDEAAAQTTALYVRTAAQRQEDRVISSPSDDAWIALTTLVPATDPFWTAFMAAIDSIKSRIEIGASPITVVGELMTENPGFKHPSVVEHAKQILTREATLKKRLLAFASGPDDL